MDLPSEDALRFLVKTYARLQASHADAFRESVLIQPDASHFPDEITLSPEGIATLFRRMTSYAPIADDVPIAFAFLEEEASSGGGCSSGACGTGGGAGGVRGGVVEEDDRYVVGLSTFDAKDPALLTTSLARSIGAIVRFEGDLAAKKSDGPVAGAEAEITAVAIGFGVLLANGAHIYAKGCGGVRMHQGTHLSLEEIAVALALFTRLHAIAPSEARKHLPTTQREAFADALAWVDANAAILTALREHPESLVDGVLPRTEPQGFFSRIFGKKSDLPSREELLRSARSPRTPEQMRRLAEAKALVQETLK